MSASHRRRSRRTLILAAATAWFLAGCGADAPGGIGPVPVWDLDLVQQIGSIDDVDQSLTEIGEVILSSNGLLLVGQPDLRNVRVYDGDGRLVRTIGRRGEGPTEIGTLRTMGLLGDDLWIQDPRNLQLKWFDLDGTFRRGERWTSETIGDGRVLGRLESPADMQVLSDGTSLILPGIIVAVTAGPTGGSDGPDELLQFALRLAPDRSIQDTIAFVDLDPVEIPARAARVVQVAPIMRLMREGGGVAWVNRDPQEGPGAAFRMVRVDAAGDTVFDRAIPYEPLPLPESLIDARREEIGEERLRVVYTDGLWSPATMPPVTSLTATSEGTLWIGREDSGAGVTWWAIDSGTGLPIGSVRLPSGHEVVEQRGDALVVARTDDLDVPYLDWYVITRPESR